MVRVYIHTYIYAYLHKTEVRLRIYIHTYMYAYLHKTEVRLWLGTYVCMYTFMPIHGRAKGRFSKGACQLQVQGHACFQRRAHQCYGGGSCRTHHERVSCLYKD
jgi:hypothetical protein